MLSRFSSSRIVGKSWKKIDSPHVETSKKLKKEKNRESSSRVNCEKDENIEQDGSASTKKRTASAAPKRAKVLGDRILKALNEVETLTSSAGNVVQEKAQKSASSVMSAITTLKQKMKSSTKRKKRLVTAAPSPFKSDLLPTTPVLRRRSERLMGYRDVKMYSPFGFDSPLSPRTPVQPRMGITDRHTPRPLFNSPDSMGDLLANDMQALANLSDGWSTPGTARKLSRSKIRTTPRLTRRSSRARKPLFV